MIVARTSSSQLGRRFVNLIFEMLQSLGNNRGVDQWTKVRQPSVTKWEREFSLHVERSVILELHDGVKIFWSSLKMIEQLFGSRICAGNRDWISASFFHSKSWKVYRWSGWSFSDDEKSFSQQMTNMERCHSGIRTMFFKGLPVTSKTSEFFYLRTIFVDVSLFLSKYRAKTFPVVLMRNIR